MKKYLEVSENIDWDHPEINKLAKVLAADKHSDVDIAKSCFEWVRMKSNIAGIIN